MKIGDRIKALREKAGLSQAKLAELAHLGIKEHGASRISNYEIGRRAPNSRDIQAISKALSRYIGNIDPGWIQFGTGVNPLFLNKNEAITPNRFVQLLNWNEISDSLKGILPERIRQKVPMFNDKCSDKAFALKIKGDAMRATITSNASFLENDVIILDPEYPTSAGDFVIAQIEDNPEPLFRQLIEEQGIEYLKPMNHQYHIIKVTHEVKILAKLVAHIKTFI